MMRYFDKEGRATSSKGEQASGLEVHSGTCGACESYVPRIAEGTLEEGFCYCDPPRPMAFPGAAPGMIQAAKAVAFMIQPINPPVHAKRIGCRACRSYLDYPITE